MDNFKHNGGIFIFIIRQESTLSSIWKYIVLILIIWIKIYGFSEIKFTVSQKITVSQNIVENDTPRSLITFRQLFADIFMCQKFRAEVK